MSMTKKNFIALAEVLKSYNNKGAIILAIADVCQDDNSLFDKEIFLEECGFYELYPNATREPTE